jgi:hypothetical protein
LMETPKHQVLGRLALSALMIEWGTMWSGLMIFQLDDSQPSDKAFAITLTIVVVVTNTILLICFVVQFIRAKIHERTEAAQLAALTPKKTKNASFLSAGFSALSKRFGSGGEVELTTFENPMQEKGVKNEIKKKKRNSRMKKVRKKLSIGARVKRTSHVGDGGVRGGEANTVLDVEAAVSIHVDEVSGRRYSYNKVTGHTQWLSDEDEGDEATVEEQGESTNKIRIAAFDYVAAESGELDMKVGDKIELLGAIDDDDDWGKGKNLRTGNVGDFPVGYLEFNL